MTKQRLRVAYFDDPVKLGERLREARETLGMSQRGLSFPGCTAAYISRIEKGERIPSLQLASVLAEKIGVTVSWLTFGKDPDPTDLEAQLVAARLRIAELEATLKSISALARGTVEK